MKPVIYCLIIFVPMLSQAAIQKILDITAESDSGIQSVMSIDVGNQNAVANIVYRPNANESELKTFPTQKLLEDTVTIKSEKGVSIVGVKLKQINSTSYIVNLHYLYHFKLLKKTYKDKQLNVAYSSPDNRYLVQDADSKKQISKLHFISHFNDKGKEVGIEKIETL